MAFDSLSFDVQSFSEDAFGFDESAGSFSDESFSRDAFWDESFDFGDVVTVAGGATGGSRKKQWDFDLSRRHRYDLPKPFSEEAKKPVKKPSIKQPEKLVVSTAVLDDDEEAIIWIMSMLP